MTASGRIIVKRVGEGPLWSIGSTYFSPAVVEHAKSVPGVNYSAPTRAWHGYVDAIAAVVARLATKGIRCDGAEDLPPPDSWTTARTAFLFATASLREYQIEGVRFCIARAREGALLADGMRLGKSLQSITAARAFKQKTLVICPSHVVGVWSRSKDAPEGPGEIAKWWPDAWKGVNGEATDENPGVIHLESIKPFKAQSLIKKLSKKKPESLTRTETAALATARIEIEGFAKKIENVQVIVCHYDIVYAWVDVLLAWGLGTLIIDEAHVLSGWMSRRSDAIKDVRGAANRVICLTGTPITNTPSKLHNLLDIIAPNRFGYFFTGQRAGCYSRLFCGSFQKTIGDGPDAKVVWDHSGRSNLDEPDGKYALTKEETLHARLQYLMLRRLKKDVDPQLPQKTRQIVDVSIPARHIIHVSPKMLGPGGGELRRCLDLAADGKLKAVVDLVASHLLEGEKVLCFCYRRLFAERVADELISAPRYSNVRSIGTDEDTRIRVEFVHGGLTQKERDKRIHTLRKHKGPGVLACTIDTTSTGIDLSFASVAVVGELTYEPHEAAQCEERLYKFGANSKSLIQYVIARGTGDELILRAVIQKLDTFEKTIGETGDSMKEELMAKKEPGLKRLYKALVAMQKAGTAALDDEPKPKKLKAERLEEPEAPAAPEAPEAAPKKLKAKASKTKMRREAPP